MFLFTFPSAKSAANDWLLVLFTIILDDQDCDLLLGQIIRSLAILTPPLNSDPEILKMIKNVAREDPGSSAHGRG